MRNCGKYLLIVPMGKCGFFAHFFQVIGALARLRASASPPAPVVYWNAAFPYWSTEGMHGTRNAWEYFFHPVSEGLSSHELLGRAREDEMDRLPGHALKEKFSGSCILVTDEHFMSEVGIFGILTEGQMAQAAEIAKTRIRVREEILKEVDGMKEDLFEGRRAVGVSFRGPEKTREVEFAMKCPYKGIGEYGRRVDAYLEEAPDAVVFLATDYSPAHEAFASRYGRRFRSIQAKRSCGYVLDDGVGPENGKEVLVDALLLASCERMIHGISNVSSAARVFSPGLPHEDVYEGVPFRRDPRDMESFVRDAIRDPALTGGGVS